MSILVDVLIVAGVVVFFLAGRKQGLVAGLLSFTGLIGGGFLGLKAAPFVAEHVVPDSPAYVPAVLSVVIGAVVGQIIASGIGFALRDRIRWRSAQAVDALGGGFLSVLAFLVVAWVIGTTLVSSPYQAAARAVRGSALMPLVDGVVPSPAQRQISAFRNMVDAGGFPQVIGAYADIPELNGPAPDQGVAGAQAVQAASTQVARISGTSVCNNEIIGSGFAYAPEHILTNAHVVAGVRKPVVELGGQNYPATIVGYDPDTDLASLYVPGLQGQILPVAPGPAPEGSSGAVSGYPGGKFVVNAARIAQTIDIQGPTIYQDKTIKRNVYLVQADIEPGISGGPLLTPNGEVQGVVFAADRNQVDAGYALTWQQVAPFTQATAGATTEVSSRSCTP